MGRKPELGGSLAGRDLARNRLTKHGRGWFRTSDLSRVKRQYYGGQKPHQQAVCATFCLGGQAPRITRDYARLPGIRAER